MSYATQSYGKSSSSGAREFLNSDRIRLAHEQRMLELDNSMRHYKATYRQLREDAQLELLHIVAHAHVYKEYSYSEEDVRNLRLDSDSYRSHHRKRDAKTPKQSTRSEAIGVQVYDKLSSKARGISHVNEDKLSSKARGISHVNEAKAPSRAARKVSIDDSLNDQLGSKNTTQNTDKDSIASISNDATPILAATKLSETSELLEVSPTSAAVYDKQLADTPTLPSNRRRKYSAVVAPMVTVTPIVDKPLEKLDLSFFLTEAIPEKTEEELKEAQNEVQEQLTLRVSENDTHNDQTGKARFCREVISPPIENFQPRSYEDKSRTENACNTRLWKYLLLPSLVQSERKPRTRKKTVIERPKYVPTRPKQQRLKLWETAISRSDRESHVFPDNCKNTYAFRRMVDEKVHRLIYDWSPTNVRKVKAKCILDVEHTHPEVLVDRHRTTSALFRNYREIQSHKSRSSESPLSSRKSHTNNQTRCYPAASNGNGISDIDAY